MPFIYASCYESWIASFWINEKIHFLLYSFPSPPIPCGGDVLQSKWLLGPHLKTIPWWRLVKNAAAPLVKRVPPGNTWSACSDLHGAISWCLGGIRVWLLNWLESTFTSLVFAFLCATVAHISTLSGPCGFTYHLYTLKHVQWWSIAILWCILH